MVKPAGETDTYEEGSPEEEKSESKEEAQAEGDNNDGEGVVVSPEFQQGIHNLIKGASKHEVKHARDRISEREDEIRKAEYEQEKKNKGSEKGNDENATLSTEGMPY